MPADEARHEEALRAARAPYPQDDSYPEPVVPPQGSTLRWPGSEVELSPHFHDVREVTIPRRFDLSAVDFVGYVSTVSAYLTLPAATRHQALRAIRAALPDVVPVTADLTMHLARRT